MGLVMTTQQIGSLYPRQLLQGSVNARPASFCQVFCDEKKFGHKKLSNVAQSSRPRSQPISLRVVQARLSPNVNTWHQYPHELQLLKLISMTRNLLLSARLSDDQHKCRPGLES